MSVSDQFKSFCINIRINNDSVNNISYRYKRITKQLNKDFWDTESETSHSLYVGSYGRDTEIHVSDIDMLFRLPFAYYTNYDNYIGNGQSALLQTVKNSLQNTYSTSHVSGDGQVVKIEFDDGIGFEIVPCFINDDDSFTFPDTNNGGAWKSTDPKPEIKEIRTSNENWNFNLKRLCRMARAWKAKWEVPIGGLLIDTFAYNFLTTWEFRNNSYVYYDWMSRDFFAFIKDQNPEQKYWLAPGSNQYVWRKGSFEYKALRCYNISLEAIAAESEGYTYTANGKWVEIFGSIFNR